MGTDIEEQNQSDLRQYHSLLSVPVPVPVPVSGTRPEMISSIYIYIYIYALLLYTNNPNIKVLTCHTPRYKLALDLNANAF
jgi:hypothetical protein